MTLIIETGTGVRTANSYVTEAFVTQYLTSLGRQSEASWDTLTTPQREAAILAATQYVETRWGSRFKGTRRHSFQGESAKALLTISAQVTSGETLTVGTSLFNFVAVSDDFNNFEIEIGLDVDETIQNVIGSINQEYEVVAQLREGSSTQILLSSDTFGDSGNDTPLGTTSSSITIDAQFQNGRDAGTQPLSFPRSGLFQECGTPVSGIPLNLKQAVAEYAVRAANSNLYVDPSTDSSGRIVQSKREKVGPLEEEITYAEGAVLEQILKPYPAADRMLLPYLTARGVVR